MTMYTIQLRRTQKGRNGSTQYCFPVKTFALWFAAGYQAAFNDMGRGDLYVRVVDDHQRIIADAPELERKARGG